MVAGWFALLKKFTDSLFRDTSPVSTAIVNAHCGEVSASSSQFWRIVLPFTP